MVNRLLLRFPAAENSFAGLQGKMNRITGLNDFRGIGKAFLPIGLSRTGSPQELDRSGQLLLVTASTRARSAGAARSTNSGPSDESGESHARWEAGRRVPKSGKRALRSLG